MKQTTRWTCSTCDHRVSALFCPDCGEKRLVPRDLTLRGFLAQIALVCTNIDGPLLRSFRWLVARPGALTEAWLQGRRKAFAQPLQLFLFANVLFFAAQSLTGVALAVVGIDVALGGAGLQSETFDHSLSSVEVAIGGVWLYFSTGVVYGGKGPARWARMVPLVVAAAAIVPGYRFAVLVFTLYTT